MRLRVSTCRHPDPCRTTFSTQHTPGSHAAGPLRPWSDPRQEATTSEGAGAHDVWDRIFSLAHAHLHRRGLVEEGLGVVGTRMQHTVLSSTP